MAATDDNPSAQARMPWLILVIDDEPEVHTITRIALRDCEFLARRLRIMSAMSATEARDLLQLHPDIALAFVDVVMESEQAGLELVTFIRQVLGNDAIRLILRTGQAGAAPERDVIRDFDINDYLAKTSLSSGKLYTATIAALRTYSHLRSMQQAHHRLDRYRLGLEAVLAASTKLFESRSVAVMARELLSHAGLLLHGGQPASQAGRVDGLAVESGAQGYVPLSAVGRFTEPWPVVFEPSVVSALDAALASGRSQLLPGAYVGIFPLAQGSCILVYLDGLDDARVCDPRILDLLSRHATIAFRNLWLERDLVDAQGEMISTLSMVLAMRSVESGNHVRRVAHLSLMLARLSGLPEDECQILFIVAPMHDIGKIGIPEAILSKPAALTGPEWDIMRQHTRMGASLFEGSSRPLLRAAAIVAGQHHEWFDGTGYPDGLRQDGIHLFARIVSIVDAFDALSHRRSYKAAWDFERVREELQSGRGSHFDPGLVDLLLANADAAIEVLRLFPDDGDPEWLRPPDQPAPITGSTA